MGREEERRISNPGSELLPRRESEKEGEDIAWDETTIKSKGGGQQRIQNIFIHALCTMLPVTRDRQRFVTRTVYSVQAKVRVTLICISDWHVTLCKHLSESLFVDPQLDRHNGRRRASG